MTVEWIRAGTGQIMTRLRAEIGAGAPRPDVLLLADGLTFEALRAEGLARVDMFLAPDGRVLVNEINTMPGFTPISMFPQLWAASGLSYTELVDELVGLAVERHDRRSRFETGR